MFVYGLVAIAGVLIGSNKNLNNKDLLQAGVGVTLASMLFSYLTVMLNLMSVDALIGSSLSMALGAMAIVIGPIIAMVLSLVLYLLVAFVTATFVRMR